MHMIELIDLTKSFRGLDAVKNVDLRVNKGTIYGFLGPNGAGKTTTIKMMAGILKPSNGRIVINGMDLNENPSEVKRCVGFIPDRPFLYEKLTGKEFLRFVAGLYYLNHDRIIESRIAELLDLFELSHWQEELIESYSHGMKQRLVMCSALIHEPEVLIIDEPMVGLDPRGARLVKNILKDQARKGNTIFMSTHSLEVAQEVCNEVAIIQSGRIIATGTAEDLKSKAGVDGNLEKVFLKLTEGKMLAHEKSLSSS
ncbi:ABC transporter ATP-binding protein [Thermodesulfobacteriota bacterium]